MPKRGSTRVINDDLHLHKAVLTRAIADLEIAASAQFRPYVRVKERGIVSRLEILFYLFSSEAEAHLFSLDSICNYLDMDPENIRMGLLLYWKTIRMIRKRRGRRLGRHASFRRWGFPPIGPWCFEHRPVDTRAETDDD